jgi:acetyl-CoA acetyltransferase
MNLRGILSEAQAGQVTMIPVLCFAVFAPPPAALVRWLGTHQHISSDSSVETLARLRPILRPDNPKINGTACSASGQNDDAAVCVVTTAEKAAEHGLRALVRLVPGGLGGVPSRTMGIGPVPTVVRALDVARLALEDIDLVELNGPFAAQVLVRIREWGDSTVSTCMARASPWRIRWVPQGDAFSARSVGRWSAAMPGTAWRRCASAVARASPPFEWAAP